MKIFGLNFVVMFTGTGFQLSRMITFFRVTETYFCGIWEKALDKKAEIWSNYWDIYSEVTAYADY